MRKNIIVSLLALVVLYQISFIKEALLYVQGYLNIFVQNNPGTSNAMITSFCAAIVAIIALMVNSSINVRNKRIDVIVHCNNRYDNIYQEKTVLEKEGESTEGLRKRSSYFSRYWGLKSDQLDYWFAGYIDPETIISWFMYTTNSIKENCRIAGESYGENWEKEKAGQNVTNQRLVEVMEFIIGYASRIKLPRNIEKENELTYSVLLEYFRILENNERILISQLSRNTFSRYYINKFSWTLRNSYLDSLDFFDTRSGLGQAINTILRGFYRTSFNKNLPRTRSRKKFEALRQKIRLMPEFSSESIEKDRPTARSSDFQICLGKLLISWTRR